jgi:hypothetical protein
MTVCLVLLSIIFAILIVRLFMVKEGFQTDATQTATQTAIQTNPNLLKGSEISITTYILTLRNKTIKNYNFNI